MKGSKTIAYSRDDSGSLRRTHTYIRYRREPLSTGRVPVDAAAARDRSVRNARPSGAPDDLLVRVDAIEQRLTRLQRYPQFWHDDDMRQFLSVWPTLRALAQQTGA